VLRAAFFWSQFGFVTFWCKNNGAKAARKMLMKLIPGYESGKAKMTVLTNGTKPF